MSKIKIKGSEIFKDISYSLSVVLNSGLSGFVENVGMKASFIILLQREDQQFNIQIFSGLNQVMSFGKSLFHIKNINGMKSKIINIRILEFEISVKFNEN